MKKNRGFKRQLKKEIKKLIEENEILRGKNYELCKDNKLLDKNLAAWQNFVERPTVEYSMERDPYSECFIVHTELKAPIARFLHIEGRHRLPNDYEPRFLENLLGDAAKSIGMKLSEKFTFVKKGEFKGELFHDEVAFPFPIPFQSVGG